MQGKAELRCPECKAQWSYTEVRKLAKLTLKEQEYFEERLGNNTTRKIIDTKNVCTLFYQSLHCLNNHELRVVYCFNMHTKCISISSSVLVVDGSLRDQTYLISVLNALFALKIRAKPLSSAGSV